VIFDIGFAERRQVEQSPSKRELRPRIQQIVDEIIDRVEPCGRMASLANSGRRPARSQEFFLCHVSL
jgi:hypothetical protein